MKYIIDGYNLIHKIRLLKGKNLSGQRAGLIKALESAQTTNNRLKDLTVVFDGQANQISSRQLHSTVKVIFSRGASADSKIKQLIEATTFARDIAVVSDDREVRFYASSLSAKKVSVKEFLKMLGCCNKKKDERILNAAEVKKINQELKKIWL